MKKTIIIIFINIVFLNYSYSQKIKIYDVNIDTNVQFEDALKIAKTENKHLMLQIGGNWCSWCIKFHQFYKNDSELDSFLNANYVIINVDYSPKKDQRLFTKLEYPQRFGFPVFVVTDFNGRRIHTQNSWYLEDGKDSYDKKKVMSFFKNWTPKSINPKSYIK